MTESGLGRGVLNNRIGSFRSADVEVIHEDGTLLATPRHSRSGRLRRGHRQKPKTVEELLCRLGLQVHTIYIGSSMLSNVICEQFRTQNDTKWLLLEILTNIIIMLHIVDNK